MIDSKPRRLNSKNKILFLNHASDKNHMQFMDNLFELHTLYPIIESGEMDYEVLWVGSAVGIIGPELDWEVFNKCSVFKPDIIVLYGWDYRVSDKEKRESVSCFTLNLIRLLLPDIKIIPILFDQAFDNFSASDNLLRMCDFAFTHEMKAVYEGYTSYPDKHFLIPPIITEQFNGNPDSQRDIDLLFIGGRGGRYPPERKSGIEALQSHGYNVYMPGGRSSSEGFISNEKLIDYTKRSKIALNWTKHISGRWHQAKGRIFEVTLAGCLLVCEECEAVNKFFKPNIDYVPFSNEDELVRKVKYYLSNESDRIKIARNGWKVAMASHSSNVTRSCMLQLINSTSFFDIEEAKYTLAQYATLNEKEVAVMFKERLSGRHCIDEKQLHEAVQFTAKSYNSLWRKLKHVFSYILKYHNPFRIVSYVPLVKIILPKKIYNITKRILKPILLGK